MHRAVLIDSAFEDLDVAVLMSHATWHFTIDAYGELAVVALYDENSLLEFKSDGYE